MAIIITSCEFRWDLNTQDKPWHYYRVISQEVPRVAPPLTDPSVDPGQQSRYFIIVLARTVTEVATKLLDSGWVFLISSVYRHDPQAIPSEFTDMRTMVDVTDQFFRAADALDFFLQNDVILATDSGMGVDDNPTEFFEIEGGQGSLAQLWIGGTSPVSVVWNPSNFFSYVPKGGLVLGGRSGQAQAMWSYVAHGGLVLRSTTPFQPISVLGTGLNLSLGGHAPATIVGTEETEAKSVSAVTTDARALYANVDGDIIDAEATALENISTACCPATGTNALLTLVHNLNLTQNLSQFVSRNGETIPNNLNMVYRSVTGLWQRNHLFKSQFVSGRQWQLMFEFGCVFDAFGATDLQPPEAVWKFAMNATYTDPIENQKFTTRLLLYFDRSEICPVTQSALLNFTFTFDPRTSIPSPSTVFEPVFIDDAGLYKSLFWIDNPSMPIASFTLFSFIDSGSIFYNYPELKAPILDPRSAPPLGYSEGFELVGS